MNQQDLINAPDIPLGDLIEESDKRNNDNTLSLDSIKGISTNKEFIETKANMDGVSLTSYKIVAPREFAYVSDTSRRGDKVALAFNKNNISVLISSVYSVFRSKDENILLPEYLFLLLNRPEFDRYARFNSWGSARETLDFSELCRIKIPLSSIDTQREIVSVYEGLQQIISENEAIIKPLEESCRAFIVDCQKRYPKVKLEDWIIESDERNQNLSVHLSQGISNLKYFQNPKQVAENSKSDKIVRTGQFAYNRATTRNGEKISIAYRDGEDCTVSSSYGVFSINNEEQLNPKYLMLLFRRAEFDRYARWRSEGSAHEFFTFEMMQNVMIPFPPKEIQDSIVDLFRCLENSRNIISESRKVMKTLCPALIQKAVHSA